MANPSTKNGHLDIANELVEYLAKIHLSGNEYQIIWAVLRKTWCWKNGDKKKDFDWISLSQFEKITDLNRVAVCRAKKLLLLKKILIEENEKIGLNQDYSQWVVSKTTLVSKTAIGSVENGNRVVSKTTHTIDTLTKDNNTKDTMKNKKYFLNQYRERLGKEPMETKLTEKQLDFITRSSLIEYFKKAVNEIHSKSYFTDPDDIADLKKENSKINGQIKLFWGRCKKNKKKAEEVIDWYSREYGKWKNWSPGFCFRKDTVIDFENKGVETNRKNVGVVKTGKGVFE